MSSSQVYPPVSGVVSSDQMCGDVTAGLVSNDWYGSTTYAYQDPYVTPYPSSTVESQPWTQYARASIPNIGMSTYGLGQQSQHAQQQFSANAPGRPRSSPSTFGPNTDSIPWATNGGLGIEYSNAIGQPTPVTSTFPPNVFQAYQSEEYVSTSSPPEIRQPQPKRPYASIAPNPEGVAAAAAKRKYEETEASSASGKRRKRTSSVVSADLSEDDRFLVQLKEDESLPWKDIATRFQSDKGKNFQVAALQMRYKRLREKFRVWEEQDMSALRLAHEYWEKYKWEIISAKMLDFGIQERWPARHCARKWQEVEMLATTMASTTGMTPASISHFSSPVEGPVHFAFMPIQ